MPFIEHLRELRNRLILCVLFVLAGTIIGWVWYDHGLLHFLTRPYCALPADRRFDGAGDCKLPFFGVLDGFTTRLKVGALAGVVITAPLWLYQLWAFVTPGLRPTERRYTVAFVVASSVLFAVGASLAYITLYKGLNILTAAAGSQAAPLIGVKEYLSFVTTLLIIFGASFEVPLLVVMLNMVGILSFERLKRWQRIGIFLIFVFAAVATPTGDPFTMLALAVPMCLLFEASVLVAYIHDRRKARRAAAAGFDDISDDEASPLEHEPSPVDTEPSG